MYEIKKLKAHRKNKTDYIILCQAKNLFPTGVPLDPSITRGNRRYTWGTWQNYFMSRTGEYRLPCHFFTEFIDNDYVIYNGLGISQRSYFLDDLIDLGVIDRAYRDSIFVLIQEDLEVDKLENRFYEHLCDKLICPMMLEYNIQPSRVVYIDEILNINWQEKQLQTKLDYGITEARFYNRTQLLQYINRYRRFV